MKTITEKLDELEKTAKFRSSFLSDYVTIIDSLRVAVEALEEINISGLNGKRGLPSNALVTIKAKLGVPDDHDR